MLKSIKIANLFGVPVIVHWTLLLAFGLGIGYGYSHMGLFAAGILGGYILCIAFSVLLHEYGHVIAAQCFGIKTNAIIMTPIGGLAGMEAYPDRPWKRFVVAVAGPLVSLFLFIFFTILFAQHAEWDANHGGFLAILSRVNYYIMLFNLLPIYPMDGGQIMHSIFSTLFRQQSADKLTLRFSQLLAVGLLSYAVWTSSISLGVIAVFMFMLVTKEFGSGSSANEKAVPEEAIAPPHADQAPAPLRT